MKILKYLLLLTGLLLTGLLFMNGISIQDENLGLSEEIEGEDNYANTGRRALIDVAPFKEDLFCWRETYGRGVGTIPTICPNGMENQGGLCYTLCSTGYYGVGPVCWKSCPAGYRDDGAFCFKPAPYGRGGGYPWHAGDPLNDTKMFERCEKDHGKGNCEKYGLIVYPKCKENFHPAGCCVCSPDCPAGWTDIGISCTKPSYGRGVGLVPTICKDGKENNAGLCYQPCRAGYKGVGPVCWEVTCPTVNGTQWIDCGAGCAQSTKTCATAVIDMAISPLVAVLSIAGMVVTGGASGAISATATTGKVIKYTAKAVKGVSKISQAAIKNDLMAKAREQLNGQPMPEHQRKGIEEYAAMAYDAARTYDFDWRDFAGFDPTGLGSVAAAYANPLCRDIKSSTTPTPTITKPRNITAPVVSPISPLGNGYVRIQNSWYKKNYIHNRNGKIEQGPIELNSSSAHWKVIPAHSGWVRIQNRWHPDQYLHNQNGKLEVGKIQNNWASAMWKLVPVHSGWVRIQNSWYKDHYIHNQNGKIELGPIQPNWASAMWKAE